MGDEDDGDAVRLELGDDAQEPVRLRRGEARCRLVHNDDARVERERLGNFEQLALGERQVRHEIVDPEIDVETLEKRAHDAPDRATVDEPERPGAQRLAPDEDIRPDIEVFEEIEFLMDEGDASRQGVADG